MEKIYIPALALSVNWSVCSGYFSILFSRILFFIPSLRILFLTIPKVAIDPRSNTFYPRPLNEKEGETMTIGSCFDEPLTIVLPTILSLPLLVLRSSFPSPYFLFSRPEPFQIADPDNSR